MLDDYEHPGPIFDLETRDRQRGDIEVDVCIMIEAPEAPDRGTLGAEDRSTGGSGEDVELADHIFDHIAAHRAEPHPPIRVLISDREEVVTEANRGGIGLDPDCVRVRDRCVTSCHDALVDPDGMLGRGAEVVRRDRPHKA